MMKSSSYNLHPPDLHELAEVIEKALLQNYETASATVEPCPDLRNAPFHLAAQGLTGNERIADIGGQPNLYPIPVLSARYSFTTTAKAMNMLDTKGSGMLIGAGAGPFFDVNTNSELAPNISWTLHSPDSNPEVINRTHYTRTNPDGTASCTPSPTNNFALMMNLYGSSGLPGPVLKVTARKRTGKRSLTDAIRFGLYDHYGPETPISMGGVFVIKKGKAQYHVMPDFPPKNQMPFKSTRQLNEWLTWHEFGAPMVCLSVFHTAEPQLKPGEKKLGLRMEHTHCFAPERTDQGGHYHIDVDGEEEVEYEGYFNTAMVLYRIDQPETTLERDLHD